MPRNAGRVFVVAPFTYIAANPSHSQQTWDELTKTGQTDLQREYVNTAKAATALLPKTSSRGRKSSPPHFWLLDDSNNTKLLWASLSPFEQKSLRLHFTTGKYRRLIQNMRNENKETVLFNTEKRGRQMKMPPIFCKFIMTFINSDNIYSTSLKDSLFETAISDFAGNELETQNTLLFPLCQYIVDFIIDHNDADIPNVWEHLLTSKQMLVRVRFLCDLREKTIGRDKKHTWKRCKPPLGWEDSASWKQLNAKQQFFAKYNYEVCKYPEDNSSMDLRCVNLSYDDSLVLSITV